jgi:hypothetical protein
MIATLSLLGCSSDKPRLKATINQDASLTGELPANPLRGKVISSSINRPDSTMSTLYGNDIAATYARTHTQHDYPNGAVLSLVTWNQRGDDRWFGAKIPDRPKSVEFVFVAAAADGHASYSYQKFEGTPLKKVSSQDGATPNEPALALLSQRAAVMP